MRVEETITLLKDGICRGKALIIGSIIKINGEKMKNKILPLILAFFAVLINPAFVNAGEIDILLDKLVEKGILTPVEAGIIKDETQQAVKEELAKGTAATVPEWVQKIKVKGDLRLRYQYDKSEAGNSYSRNRGRIRYRLGMEARPVDNLSVGAGLASGGTDPRSTNQTWENTFETPDIRLDYAYAEWDTPVEGLKVTAGRILNKDYLWRPTDLLWDSDINPYGGSAHYEHSLGDITAFINAGNWIIDENNAVKNADPFLIYGQGGLAYKGEKTDAKIAGIYYGFNGIQGINPDHDAGSNTYDGSTWRYDYDSVGVSAEIGFKRPFGGLPFGADDRIAIFADYIQNVDDIDDNTGWAYGVKFGNAKVSGPKTWQMKYIYAQLGKDSWPDVFPDSDRLGGKTDMKSHEIAFEYGVTKNVTFGIDYYYSRRQEANDNHEHLLQADLVFKF